MPPNPLRTAQTTSEAKKQHKQNGLRLPERQMKQLARGHELDARAARLRDAEKSRRAAKKKREEREERERIARKQMGVGRATQLIGYSHTQAQLKNGMEAFLGLKRRAEDEQRRRNLELTKTLDAIAQTVEKEPWDDDVEALDLHVTADVPLAPPLAPPEPFVDDDLDDDSLLEAHDLLMSDPAPPHPTPARDDADFARLHGPTNKAIESMLDTLPEPLVELLSQDVSLRLPHWDPPPGLLHKLNPVGLPPHRLRVKVGSVVSLLRHPNTSNQLSNTNHLRILRAEKERLECVVLDGQLQGTRALLTRIPFPAKYRNDSQCTFQRLQFPVRIAADYTCPNPLLGAPPLSSASMLLSVPRHVRSSSSSENTNPHPQNTKNLAFKVPALPAAKKSMSDIPPPKPTREAVPFPLPSPSDCWDDFLDSGTQIARELSHAPVRSIQPPPVTESLPPLSTQDLDFSMDDLDDAPGPTLARSKVPNSAPSLVRTTSLPVVTKPPSSHPPPSKSTVNAARTVPPRKVKSPCKAKSLPQQLIVPGLRREDISPSQRPSSVSDRPTLFKRKAHTTPPYSTKQLKRSCTVATRPTAASNPINPRTTMLALSDFGISTQEAASLFSDDDDLCSGSPPIAV